MKAGEEHLERRIREVLFHVYTFLTPWAFLLIRGRARRRECGGRPQLLKREKVYRVWSGVPAPAQSAELSNYESI